MTQVTSETVEEQEGKLQIFLEILFISAISRYRYVCVPHCIIFGL